MAVSPAFRDHVLDLFAPLGDITLKTMFGGAGIYHKDQIFGLIIAERIYLKTDDQTRPAFQREGVQPFRYSTKNGEIGVMAYWELPERLLDDPDELKAWAKAAYEAGIRARGKKKSTAGKAKKGRPLSMNDLPLVSPKTKGR